MATNPAQRAVEARSETPDPRSHTDDGLHAFGTESHPAVALAPKPVPPAASPRPRPPLPPATKQALTLAAIVLVGAGLTFSGLWAYQTYGMTPETASLSVQTTPAGAAVSINGQASGATPVALTLPPGSYQVRLATASGQERTLDVTLKPGESVVQHIELAAAPAAPATTGALHVQTDPPGQTVTVDDVRRGVSPLTIEGLAPGDHQVVVTSPAGSLRRQITIAAGNTLSVVIAPHAPAVNAGWLRVRSPVLLQVRSGDNLVGNSESDRVLLPAGEHDLELRNDALGFATRRRVTVTAGRAAEISVPLPNGTLNINAAPWAEVWIDGEQVGETPLGNLSRPIGVHRVTFRHPQLGEREATVTVTLKETARLAVDMRQP